MRWFFRPRLHREVEPPAVPAGATIIGALCLYALLRLGIDIAIVLVRAAEAVVP